MRKLILNIAIIIITGFTGVSAQSATTTFDVDGIKVIYKPIIKDIVNVQIYFRSGVADYPASQAGIENFAMEALTDCGTKKYPSNNFKDIQDKYGLILNSGAYDDYGVVRLNCISKYFNQGWDLFADAVNNPAFPADQVDILRRRIISKLKGFESNPDYHLNELLMQNAFKDTPYGINPLGTAETLGQLTANDLSSYYLSMRNKNQIFIVVVGNVTKEEITEKIKAAFSAMPSKPYEPVRNNIPLWNDNKLLAEQRPLATNYICAVVNCPPITSPDYYPFRLGLSLLSGQLYVQLRTRLKLAYDMGAVTVNLLWPYTKIYVTTNNPKQAVEEMVFLVKQAKNYNISDELLDKVKNNFITTDYMKDQSSIAIANSLGTAEITGGWQYADNAADLINSVTAPQIEIALNKFLLGFRWNYLGNTSLADATADAFATPLTN